MRVEEIHVPRYRTPDGSIFEGREEATKHADGLAIAALLNASAEQLAAVIAGTAEPADPVRLSILWVGARTMAATVPPAPVVDAPELAAGPAIAPAA